MPFDTECAPGRQGRHRAPCGPLAPCSWRSDCAGSRYHQEADPRRLLWRYAGVARHRTRPCGLPHAEQRLVARSESSAIGTRSILCIWQQREPWRTAPAPRKSSGLVRIGWTAPGRCRCLATRTLSSLQVAHMRLWTPVQDTREIERRSRRPELSGRPKPAISGRHLKVHAQGRMVCSVPHRI